MIPYIKKMIPYPINDDGPQLLYSCEEFVCK